MIKCEPIHPKGPSISNLIWGAWRCFDHEETKDLATLARLIQHCVEIGITSFDHADIYGDYQAEAHFGAAFKKTGLTREKIQIITKCGIRKISSHRPDNRVHHYDSRPVHILRSVDASLKALGTDYIDLLLIHRFDPLMNAMETAQCLDKLVASGKILSYGISNFSNDQWNLLQSFAERPIVTNQIQCSVMYLDPLLDGSLDQAQKMKARPLIWSPLGGGNLFHPKDERAQRLGAKMKEIGQHHGIDDIGIVALAWLLALPSRPLPILGTGRLDRIQSYAKAASIKLDKQDWYAIWEASIGQRLK